LPCHALFSTGFIESSSHPLSLIFCPQKSTLSGFGHYTSIVIVGGYPSIWTFNRTSTNEFFYIDLTVPGNHLPLLTSKISTSIPANA